MEKSSFLKRTLSNQDAIIQILRPKLATTTAQGLDIFERMVNGFEEITKLGTTVTGGQPQQRFVITAAELKDNLDEFEELENIATLGRELLDKLGYVSQRKSIPMTGVAPIGQSVQVQPISTQVPGQEPLQGVVIKPSQRPMKEIIAEIKAAK